MMGSENNDLELRGISKSFAQTHALRSVSFFAKGGECTALVGQNGAGKSTLIKVIAGIYAPESGTITLGKEPVRVSGARTAIQLGISVIHQEFNLVPNFTVAENIFIRDLRAGGVIVSRSRLRENAARVLQRLNLATLDVSAPVSSLSVGDQQMVEICKALVTRPRVLVFDEPSAVLTDAEVQRLFLVIRDLKRLGVCVIYVSHRLEEIFSICERATVLRDGHNAGLVDTESASKDDLISMMTGQGKISELFPERSAHIGDVSLRVEKLRVLPEWPTVSFSVRQGEVLGFFGLVGSGRTEVMRGVFGAEPRLAGNIILNGEHLRCRSPAISIAEGVGMLPEDRKLQALLLDKSIRENIMLRPMNPAHTWGLIRSKREAADSSAMMERLSIKAGDIEAIAGTLSGGNQQKTALARWLSLDSQVVILDEPTRGVDVGAKVDIYHVINLLARSGKSVIVVSSELLELIGICDRILVMKDHEIVLEVQSHEFSEHRILQAAIGEG